MQQLQKIFQDLFEPEHWPEAIENQIKKWEECVEAVEKSKLKNQKPVQNSSTTTRQIDAPAQAGAENSKPLFYLLQELNTVYWQLMQSILKSSIEKAEMQGFQLSRSSRPFVDFGFCDPRLYWKKEFIIQMQQLPEPENDSIMYLHEWLEKRYKNHIYSQGNQELLAQMAELQQDLLAVPQKIHKLQKQRQDFLKQSSQAKELAEVCRQIDSYVIPEYRLALTLNSSPDATDRLKLSDVRQARQNLQQLLSRLLYQETSFDFRRKLLKYNEQIAAALTGPFHIKDQLRSLNHDLDQDRQNQIDAYQNRVEWIQQEIFRIKSWSQLCARRANCMFTAPLNKVFDHYSKKNLSELLEFAEQFDPGLFKNSIARRKGRPDVVMIPGQGHVIYDWQLNILVIPTLPHRSLLESLVAGLVAYRLDSDDEHKMEDDLRSQVKDYKRLRRGFPFQRKFIKDYVTWMTREALGYLSLDKDTRRWFMRNIGPRFKQFRMSGHCEDLLNSNHVLSEVVNRVRKEISEPYKSQNPEWNCSLGTLYGEMELYEPAVAFLHKSLQLQAEDNHLCRYNYSMALEMYGAKKEALRNWIEFVRSAPASLWTTIAKLHIRNLLGNN